MAENIHDGHRQRVKERFLSEGLEGFAPHEVLELLLFYAVPKRDTNETAHLLLEKFGTLDRVFDAELESLTEVCGIGKNTAVLLKLMPEIAQYYLKERYNKSVKIENTEQMGEYMCSRMGMAGRELFAAAAFDADKNEIAYQVLGEGTISRSEVRIRSLAEFAIKQRADLIVIAHNHVAGAPLPSQADRDTTRKICRALAEIGIKVADHIIVAGDSYYSFAANGIMPV